MNRAVLATSLLYSLLYLWPHTAYGQINHQVQVTSGGNQTLNHQVEQSIQFALGVFQDAYRDGTQPDLSADHFTETSRTAILELWNTSPFRCIFGQLTGPLIRTYEDQYEFRGIILHVKGDGDFPVTEEGLFTFDKDGRIVEFQFGIDLHRYSTLLEERRTVREFTHRQVILHFLDQFKTAYNRRDLDFIKEIYSDNALIIVGRRVRQESPETDAAIVPQLSSTDFEYVRRTKQEYIDNLNEVFESNEFLEVRLDSIRIHRHSEIEGVYGVQLLQIWRSTNYSDRGYLFLMVDIRDDDKPIIHVRTWQPEEDVMDRDVFNLSNFDIVDG